MKTGARAAKGVNSDGLAEETSTGSIGEVVDMETLKGYRDRLREIDEELEEAPHLNQSLFTRGIYAAPGKIAPNYRGAIGVSDSGVAGVDVTVPRSSSLSARSLNSSRQLIYSPWSR